MISVLAIAASPVWAIAAGDHGAPGAVNATSAEPLVCQLEVTDFSLSAVRTVPQRSFDLDQRRAPSSN